MTFKLRFTNKSFSIFVVLLISVPTVLFFQNCGNGRFDVSSLTNDANRFSEDANTREPASPTADSGELMKLKSFGSRTDYDRIAGITADNSVVIWGNDSIKPVVLPKIANETIVDFVSIATTQCVLTQRQNVYCWGRLSMDASVPWPTVPQLMPTMGPAKQITASNFSICSLHTSGKVFCFGFLNYHRAANTALFTPTEIPEMQNAQKISVSSDAICGLMSDQTVKCNSRRDSTAAPSVVYNVETLVVPGLVQMTDIKSSSGAATIFCGTNEARDLKCVVRSDSGVFGAPVTAPNANSVVSFDLAHSGYGCATRTDNSMVCWSYNKIRSPSFLHEALYPNIHAKQLVVRYDAVCILTESNSVRCMGRGQGTTTDGVHGSLSAMPVAELDQIKQIVYVSDYMPDPFVVQHDGTVQCRYLTAPPDSVSAPALNGDGCPEEGRTQFVNFKNIKTAKQIAGHSQHMCVLLANGRISCWGDNTFFNNGTLVPSAYSDAGEVQGFSNITEIALTAFATCGLRTDGKVACVGNLSGVTFKQPALVNGLTNIKQIAATEYMMCGLSNAGTVRCTGKSLPVNNDMDYDSGLISISDVTQLFAYDGTYICAHQSTGTISCWTGLTTDLAAPLKPMPNVKKIYVSSRSNVCGITNDNMVLCQGRNMSGELGLGNTNKTDGPVLNPHLSQANNLIVGIGFTCAQNSLGTQCTGQRPLQAQFNSFGPELPRAQ